MTDQLFKAITEANSTPIGKAAIEALKGYPDAGCIVLQPDGTRKFSPNDINKLALIELLECKIAEEDRTPPDVVVEDWLDLDRALDEDLVRKITEYLSEEGLDDAKTLAEMDAETLMHWIAEALPEEELQVSVRELYSESLRQNIIFWEQPTHSGDLWQDFLHLREILFRR